jgi:hypothetical protein
MTSRQFIVPVAWLAEMVAAPTWAANATSSLAEVEAAPSLPNVDRPKEVDGLTAQVWARFDAKGVHLARRQGNILIQGSGEGKFSVPLTPLKDIRLGPALLSDLTVPMIPLPRFFTDRGTQPPIAGVVSYEFLKRYAVRVAYEEGTLTLTPTSDFRYRGKGEHISLSRAKFPWCQVLWMGLRESLKSIRVALAHLCFSARSSTNMA